MREVVVVVVVVFFITDVSGVSIKPVLKFVPYD